MNPYLNPMDPWPGLEEFQRTVTLTGVGLELFCYDTGGEPTNTTFLIHGLGDEADTWRHLIGPLSQRGRVIAPDLPGFGRSSMPPTSQTIPFFIETLLELMEALSIRKARWIGQSLGALILQSLSLDNPERVSAMTLISGSLLVRSGPLRIETLLFLVPGLGEWLYNRLRANPQKAYDSLYPYYADLDSLPPQEREFLFERVNQRVWSDTQRKAYFSTLRSLVVYTMKAQRDLEKGLAGSRIPTLVVWGEADRFNPVANAYALKEIQPELRLVTIPGGGHNLQHEHPGELIQAIQADERLGFSG